MNEIEKLKEELKQKNEIIRQLKDLVGSLEKSKISEVECWYCHKKWGKTHKCGICGREGK